MVVGVEVCGGRVGGKGYVSLARMGRHERQRRARLCERDHVLFAVGEVEQWDRRRESWRR